MQVPKEIALRADRLVSGEFEVEDLERLFGFLRLRNGGSSIVRDVGDFAHHHETRTKGAVWQLVQDVFAVHRLGVTVVQKKPVEVDDFRAGCRGALHLMGPAESWKCFKRPYNETKKILESGLAKVVVIDMDDMTVVTENGFGPHEEAIVRFLGGLIGTAPAYTAERLADEFSEALIHEGLIEKEATSKVRAQRDRIALYAAMRMHGHSVYDAKADRPVELAAGVAEGFKPGPQVLVAASVTFEWEGKEAGYRLPIFGTDCEPSTACEPDLPTEPPPVFWETPIDISERWRLRTLV